MICWDMIKLLATHPITFCCWRRAAFPNVGVEFRGHWLVAKEPAAHPRLTVFVAAATALIASTAIAVLAGSVVAEFVEPKIIRWVAGSGFIAVGLWVIFSPE